MLNKNEVKDIQTLCHKKHRQEKGLFIAEGIKVVNELLQSDYTIRKLYATQAWTETHKGVEAQVITDIELARISDRPSPNQVLAIVEQKIPAAAPMFTGHFTIALDGIQDPGNFGTIIRIADWFGIRQIIAGSDTVELYNPKTIQSAMGSFTRVNVWYGELAAMLDRAKVPVFGAVLDGENMYSVPPVSEGILLIGNEGRGISTILMSYITDPVTIPQKGGAESLNAAVATGIIVSHLLK